MSGFLRAIRWLAIIVNLVWGSLLLTVIWAAWLSRDSVTDSEERVFTVGGCIALFSAMALLFGNPKKRQA